MFPNSVLSTSSSASRSSYLYFAAACQRIGRAVLLRRPAGLAAPQYPAGRASPGVLAEDAVDVPLGVEETARSMSTGSSIV
jgi:hypothetical protein